jgi:hypothetical protein
MIGEITIDATTIVVVAVAYMFPLLPIMETGTTAART